VPLKQLVIFRQLQANEDKRIRYNTYMAMTLPWAKSTLPTSVCKLGKWPGTVVLTMPETFTYRADVWLRRSSLKLNEFAKVRFIMTIPV